MDDRVYANGLVDNWAAQHDKLQQLERYVKYLKDRERAAEEKILRTEQDITTLREKLAKIEKEKVDLLLLQVERHRRQETE